VFDVLEKTAITPSIIAKRTPPTAACLVEASQPPKLQSNNKNVVEL
jgi:hypothetical protein